MNCKKEAVFKGIVGGAAVGVLSAVAVGYGIMSLCSRDCSKLKKKARKALRTMKNYVDGIM